MISRIVDWLAPVQPAEPSTLDRADGVGTRAPAQPLCDVLHCHAAPVTEIRGWRLCRTHAPSSARL